MERISKKEANTNYSRICHCCLKQAKLTTGWFKSPGTMFLGREAGGLYYQAVNPILRSSPEFDRIFRDEKYIFCPDCIHQLYYPAASFKALRKALRDEITYFRDEIRFWQYARRRYKRSLKRYRDD